MYYLFGKSLTLIKFGLGSNMGHRSFVGWVESRQDWDSPPPDRPTCEPFLCYSQNPTKRAEDRIIPVNSFSGSQEYELLFYQIKIVIKPYKTNEFVKSMRSFSRRIRKEKGCLGFSVYRDFEKENTYSVVGEWQTRPAMEKHFQTHDFEELIGAAKVLGETFEKLIAYGRLTI